MAYLSHKVEKFQSPGCGDVNVINGFKPTFQNIHATPVPPGWKLQLPEQAVILQPTWTPAELYVNL